MQEQKYFFAVHLTQLGVCVGAFVSAELSKLLL